MSETDLDRQPPAPVSKSQAQHQTPWESMDPDESAESSGADAAAVRLTLAPQSPQAAAIAAQQSGPFASRAAASAGAGMVELASELKSLLARDHADPFGAMSSAPLETAEDYLLARAFLSDQKVESVERPPAAPAEPAAQQPAPAVAPEAEPAAIDHTPWATIDETPVAQAAAPSFSMEVASDAGLEEPVEGTDSGNVDEPGLAADGVEIEHAALAMGGTELEHAAPAADRAEIEHAALAPDIAAIEEPASVPGDEASDKGIVAPAAQSFEIATAAPVVADQSAAVGFVASVEEEEAAPSAADEPVLALEDEPAEILVTVNEATLHEATPHESIVQSEPRTQTQPQLQAEAVAAPTRVATGGGWTIPIMCMGIGLIACCLAIPQMDFNRRLRYEQQALQANLQSVEKQVAVNDEFLKKVMDDPTLAERLAGRQMKTMRKGQRPVPIKGMSDDGDMSPFALVAVAPPAAPPPYSPIKGTIANICNDGHARLYLLGAAMTMVAVGLVMGSSAKA